MPIPTKVSESKVIVGNTLIGVRQRVTRLNQVNGNTPIITGPPVVTPLDGATFAGDIYRYADAQPECLVGDSTDLNGHLYVKAINLLTDAEKMKVVVVEDPLVASVEIIGYTITIRYVAAVTTYADVLALLNAHALIPTYFACYLPAGGAGASLVTAQDVLFFTQPVLAESVLDDGGVFQFDPPIYSVRLHSIALSCGVGSVVNAAIQDRDGTNVHTLLTGASGNDVGHTIDFPFLGNQQVVIAETVSGTPAPATDKYLTIYVVKDRQF